jgi:hypothetical protein
MKPLYIDCNDITKHVVLQDVMEHAVNNNNKKIHNTYIHTHTHIHTYIHTYINTYIHTYTHIHTSHTYIHTYTHTCIHTYIHTYTHTRIHAYVHTYIHTYIHTRSSWRVQGINIGNTIRTVQYADDVVLLDEVQTVQQCIIDRLNWNWKINVEEIKVMCTVQNRFISWRTWNISCFGVEM